MNPAFLSWQAFFVMGGYGFFVWLAISATLISLIALVGYTQWQRYCLLREIRQYHVRKQRIQTIKTHNRKAIHHE